MRSENFNLYVSDPSTFIIRNSLNFAKFNLSLNLIVQMKAILIFNIRCKRYTLFLFFRINFLIFKLFTYFFI